MTLVWIGYVVSGGWMLHIVTNCTFNGILNQRENSNIEGMKSLDLDRVRYDAFESPGGCLLAFRLKLFRISIEQEDSSVDYCL